VLKRCLRIIALAVLSLLLSGNARGQGSITMNLELMPKTVIDQSPAQMLIIIESPQKLTGAAITIVPPPGFKADPPAFSLPDFTGKITQTSVFKALDSDVRPGERYVIQVQSYVSSGSGGRTLLADQTLPFDYKTNQISLRAYFALGVLGILIGYCLRLMLNVLATVPAPPLAAPPSGAVPPLVGPITAFVQKHYYSVDVLVTIALGYFALVAMSQGNRPPQTANFWYSALAMGVGLGLLTNSELLTKLRK